VKLGGEKGKGGEEKKLGDQFLTCCGHKWVLKITGRTRGGKRKKKKKGAYLRKGRKKVAGNKRRGGPPRTPKGVLVRTRKVTFFLAL